MSVYAHIELPAVETLAAEGIVVNDQTIAPDEALRIGVLNLMPLKIPTEADILRVFSDSQYDLTFNFFTTATHKSRNTPAEHIEKFYSYLRADNIARLDGLIVTGAPLEMIDYKDVDYYDEFCRILDLANAAEIPALLLCWAAFAGYYRRFGTERTILNKKISGVYSQQIYAPEHRLMSGMADSINAPQSRFITIDVGTLEGKQLDLIAGSVETGIHIAATPDCLETFVTGHGEYATETLKNEYLRDMTRGLNPDVPVNYFVDDDVNKPIINSWQSDGRRVFNNWASATVIRQKLAREHHRVEEEH